MTLSPNRAVRSEGRCVNSHQLDLVSRQLDSPVALHAIVSAITFVGGCAGGLHRGGHVGDTERSGARGARGVEVRDL